MAEAIGAAWDVAPDTSVICILDCIEESVAREVESIEKLLFFGKAVQFEVVGRIGEKRAPCLAPIQRLIFISY